MTKKYLDEIAYQITGSCIEVHKFLGEGMHKATYLNCLIHEFNQREVGFDIDIPVPIVFKGLEIANAEKIDFIVDNNILLNVMVADAITPRDEMKMMTLLRIMEIPRGVLINFNSRRIFKEGQKIIDHPLFFTLPDE